MRHYVFPVCLYLLIGVIGFLYPITIILGLVIIFLYNLRINQRRHLQIKNDLRRHEKRLAYNISKIESEKQEKAAEFSTIASQLNIGLLMTNDQGLITYINPKIISEFGFSKDKSVMLLEGSDIVKFIQKAFILKKDLETQLKVKNRFYIINACPMIRGGIFKGVIILTYDWTSLNEINQKQNIFIADVSHELKTPLTAIKGVCEILMRDAAIDSELIDIMATEVMRMEKLVHDILQYSKLEFLNEKLTYETIDMPNLMQYIYNSESKAINKPIIFKTNIMVETICANSDLLAIAIRNLIRNALLYTNTMIEANVFADDKNYYIQITNDGLGIAKHHLEHIFDRFYRADESRNRHNGGTGLGLSIVKAIASKHHGDVIAKSIEHELTSFTIRIPKRLNT